MEIVRVDELLTTPVGRGSKRASNSGGHAITGSGQNRFDKQWAEPPGRRNTPPHGTRCKLGESVHCRHTTRALRNSRRFGRGRHGRGVSGSRNAAGPRSGGEGTA